MKKLNTFSTFTNNRTVIGKFGVFKNLLESNKQYIQGGITPPTGCQLAYDSVTGLQLAVNTHQTGRNFVITGDNPGITVIVKSIVNTGSIANAQLIDLTSSITLEVDTYAVILEGVVEVDGDTYDSTTGIYVFSQDDTITGNCKLLKFQFNS